MFTKKSINSQDLNTFKYNFRDLTHINKAGRVLQTTKLNKYIKKSFRGIMLRFPLITVSLGIFSHTIGLDRATKEFKSMKSDNGRCSTEIRTGTVSRTLSITRKCKIINKVGMEPTFFSGAKLIISWYEYIN